MAVVRRGWYRLRRWVVEDRPCTNFGFAPGERPTIYIGRALRYRDRTTDYVATPDAAELHVRRLIDATILERRGRRNPPGVPRESGVYPARPKGGGPWTYVELVCGPGAPIVYGTGTEQASIGPELAERWEWGSLEHDPIS